MTEPAGDSVDHLRRQLLAAATLEDATEGLLEVTAVVAEALAELDVQPIVVGGLAMAHWSDRAFVTGDIDVVVPRRAELATRLLALGFEQHGRQWKLPDHAVIFEARADALEPGDEAEPVELASGRTVLVLSRVDLLLWRLREWLHWQSAAGFKQAAALLWSDEIDDERLERRADEEGLAAALAVAEPECAHRARRAHRGLRARRDCATARTARLLSARRCLRGLHQHRPHQGSAHRVVPYSSRTSSRIGVSGCGATRRLSCCARSERPSLSSVLSPHRTRSTPSAPT